MERLIDRDVYKDKMEPGIEEVYNLFDAIRYYGKQMTLDTAEVMFTSHHFVPLENHWDDFDSFITVWDFFYKLSRSYSRSFFGKVVVANEIPSEMLITLEQKNIFTRPEEYKKQICCLLCFFDSISDYFEYEVQMIEKGYPVKLNLAS